MPPLKEITIFWFRRDLRLHDNAALFYALRENENVLPIFIYDTEILDRLENKMDRRVDYISQSIAALDLSLQKLHSSLSVLHGKPLNIIEDLLKKFKVKNLYANVDYEPSALIRDKSVEELLKENGIETRFYKDQVIFDRSEIIKSDGTPYTVFTPYSVKWKAALTPAHYAAYDASLYYTNFYKNTPSKLPTLEDIGFKKTDLATEPLTVSDVLLNKYKENRDYPSVSGTSRLSLALRFGTVSVRELVARTLKHSETWLNELIWREFYKMILWHFPHVAHRSFKKKYDGIKWRNNEAEFDAWCRGVTGFPIVDAGMRELNTTGFMHNRVRMIVSSFLIKDLLIDWRWGEAYFANHLNDYDLSANTGGWQWAAGSGCDATPYFRIFNPTEQQKKFDPEFKYIKKWIPEFGTAGYAEPLVDHAFARLRALQEYKNAVSAEVQA